LASLDQVEAVHLPAVHCRRLALRGVDDDGRDVRSLVERDSASGTELADLRSKASPGILCAQPAEQLVERMVLLIDDDDVLNRSGVRALRRG
jgi:hypothetical protein